METFSALPAICAGNSPFRGEFPTERPVNLICVGINDWVNKREAGDLKRNRAHFDVTVTGLPAFPPLLFCAIACNIPHIVLLHVTGYKVIPFNIPTVDMNPIHYAPHSTSAWRLHSYPNGDFGDFCFTWNKGFEPLYTKRRKLTYQLNE